ncbi:release factor glutamine methyltransferase [Flavobacterium cauense R2A-7]|uniref:Release factor glutamine methyltransferase n=1 Tax=Flavobacterium cauense R2A-7 TaxID=1341154 RepID=A0A562M3N9_9FLAO|nr:peptide chain release factor N(5)-glutamine methyltransferase [Flavobacterium cauense]KGO84156.1 glutamine methyltransferase [Flavobacterium cauense R2A-7]TWI14490.1 release factor glutamine methyltransferase [Flavobacterium cauense R2A-7]
MLLKDYRTIFTQELASLYDEYETESFFYIILEDFHHMKRVDLALNPTFELSPELMHQWENVVAQLKEQRPIQYILGETEFYGLPFYVNEHTLIPRQETEELVDWIVKGNLKIERLKDLKILDIGTGTGCIAISLAKNLPNAKVFAMDVSDKALAVAKRNAERNEVTINFIHQSILETNDLGETFDIIVSNPPYVRNLEKEEIKKNVLDYEPHLALFVEDNDALLFYRKITELAIKNLSENGQLYFEINQYLGNEMVQLLQQHNFKDVELRKDIYGNDRMMKGKV